MKTTIEIADPLLDLARGIAERDGETLRSLVEQGLRKVIADRQAVAIRFKLKDASVGRPGGAPPPYESLSWEAKRALIYEGL